MTAVISCCGAGAGWMYLASCSLWLPCCFPWHCHSLENPGVCWSVWQLLHNKAGPTDSSFPASGLWLWCAVGVWGEIRAQGGCDSDDSPWCSPSLRLVWLRNLRDQRRCVPGWKALIFLLLICLTAFWARINSNHLQDANGPQRLVKILFFKHLPVTFCILRTLDWYKRGEQELLYRTVRTIPTRDSVGSFLGFSVAWEVDADVCHSKVFVLVAFPLKLIVHFSFTVSWLFFLKALSKILCIHLFSCQR